MYSSTNLSRRWTSWSFIFDLLCLISMIFCCFGQNCQCWTNYTCMPHIISSGLSQNKMTDNKLILKCHILQLWLLPYRGKQIVCVRAFYCQVSTHDFVNWKSLKEFPTDKVKQKKYSIWFLVYNFTICQWLILRLHVQIYSQMHNIYFYVSLI